MYEINSDIEAEEIKKDVLQAISDIKVNTKSDDVEDEMKSVIAESIQDIEGKYHKRDDYKYHTGLFELDKVTDGLHAQELTLIAARPRSRKDSTGFKNSRKHSEKRNLYIFCFIRNVKKTIRQQNDLKQVWDRFS